jgi:hypothetical protein
MTAGPNPIKTLLASAFLGWLFASFLLVMIFKIGADQSNHPMADQVIAIALLMAAYGIFPALIGAVLLGSVWLAHAAKRGLRSWWSYLLAGSIRGAAVGALLSGGFLAFFGLAWWATAIVGVLYSAAIGALTGSLVWSYMRPDRDAANPATPAP